MAAIQHVFRCGKIYYWRRRWPPAFGAPAGQQSLCLSLKTACVATARRRGVVLTASFDTRIGMLSAHITGRKTAAELKDMIIQGLREDLRRLNDQADWDRAQRPPDPTGEMAKKLAKQHKAQANAFRRLLATNRHLEGQPDIAEFCAKLGLNLQSNEEMAYAAYLRTRSMLDFHLQQVKRERAEFPDDHQLFMPSVADVAVPQIASTEPSQAPTVLPPPEKPDSPPLSSLFANYA